MLNTSVLSDSGFIPQNLENFRNLTGYIVEESFEEKHIRKRFMRKVFFIRFCQLLLTLGIIAFFQCFKPAHDFSESRILIKILEFILLIICLIIMTQMKIINRQPSVYIMFFFFFTLRAGIFLGAGSWIPSMTEVVVSLATLAAVCLDLICIDLKPNFETKNLIAFCHIGFLVFLIFLVLGLIKYFLCLSLSLLWLLSCGFFTFFMSMYLIIDIKMIMGGQKGPITPKEYLFAAVNIYVEITVISFVLIFLTFI